jgi:dTDP-4-dehydrorhamnose reductase
VDTWLVTGASGFLGANAGLFLADKSVSTIGLIRVGATPPHFNEALRGDLSEPELLAERLRELRPSVILHAGALASHEQCEADPKLATRINADSTRALAITAAEIGATFIYISTDAVFDGARGDYSESDEPSPFSVYGESKLLGEQYALAHAGSLVIRTNFFGWSPTGSRSILEFFVNSLRTHTPVSGYTDFTVTSTYVQFLMDAIWQLAQQQATGIVHVASADKCNKYEFATTVAEVFGLDASLILPAEAAAATHATSRTRDLSLRVDNLESLLGTKVPTQRAGILQAYDDSGTIRAELTEGRLQA